ncbi:pinin/SDK/memA/ protein conserved region-domain-containing protein [Plectosphaerella cucumerina]|uniref:Pinin/SDK/memA/ protein conserved region-domain-containing protein n=1 Tax=Plectosphaerella cucumerina TaxID=40658 RepID=A0A8K0TDA1_9PEZI|nr:pinin/SDK/memA/ protein conserved region-domain-containing protein [Plectosphaerella cucumerina]
MMEGTEVAVPIKDLDATLPEEHAGIKRRASNSPEAEEDTKKRARVEGTQSPKREDHSPTHPERRASIADDHHETKRPAVSKEEEKKRGKRLFGGLLNTLSQKTSTTQQKKRREIEQRQQEKAQKQKVEDDKRLAERLARLNRERRHDQIDFDEKVMKTRHANLIARAHSLYTKAEPRIYYKPWKLTAAQEDILDDQIAEAKATAAREVAQHARRRDEHGQHPNRDRDHSHGRRRASSPRGERLPRRSEAESSAPPPPGPEPAPEPEPPAQEQAQAAPAEAAEAANGSPEHSDKAAPPAVTEKEQPEEQGDVVVDNEEDMVMY